MCSYFDAHCDTMLKIYNDNVGIDEDKLEININNISEYENVIQVFALFNEGDLTKESMLSAFKKFKGECARFPEKVSICKSAKEISENKAPLSALLAIEGLGNQPDFSLGDIKDYYDAGVRIMSLVWNHDNALCGGNLGEDTGLTPLGKEVLFEMEKQRIILDVSHISDKGFSDVVENYTLPFCATHSVSRALVDHPRNLTDEQFLEIVKRGGVCGVNFYPPFLTGENTADCNDVIRHIEHFLSLGGENSIGLGSDFDGMPIVPSDLKNSKDFNNLFSALSSLNYSNELIEKIAFRNFTTFFAKQA